MNDESDYNPLITAKKAFFPAMGVCLVNVLISILHSNNIKIDDASVWTIAGGVYTGAVALLNWMKHKGD